MEAEKKEFADDELPFDDYVSEEFTESEENFVEETFSNSNEEDSQTNQQSQSLVGDVFANDENQNGKNEDEFSTLNDALEEDISSELTEEIKEKLISEEDREKAREEALLSSKPAEHNFKNDKAPFFARNRIFLIFSGIIVFVMLIINFIPREKKSKEVEEDLNKAGLEQIPDFINNYSSEEKPEEIEQFQEEKTPEEVEEIIKTIPNFQEGQAPVQLNNSTTSTSPVHPETNRDEMQKTTSRIKISDGGLYGNQTGGILQNQGTYKSEGQGILNYSYGQNNSSDNQINKLNDQLSVLKHASESVGVYSGYKEMNNQGNKQEFYSNSSGTVSFKQNNEMSIFKGTVISAVLETEINSDLPGEVIARVTQNIYSSLDGRYLLIPAGSRLFATYNSSITYAQDRIQIAWNTLIRPDGLEVNLGNMNGIDEKGKSGVAGFRNGHPFEYAKALGMIALFSIIDTKFSNSLKNLDSYYAQNAMADVYSATTNITDKMLDRALDIQPTIKVKNGSIVQLITNVTFELPPVERYSVEEKYKR